jgi:hypothetical protein
MVWSGGNGGARYRVTIATTVTLPAPFVRDGKADEALLLKFAAFKIQRQLGLLGYPLGRHPSIDWKIERVDNDLAVSDLPGQPPVGESRKEDK